MAKDTKLEPTEELEVKEIEEEIPSEAELMIEQLMSNGFILVQWVGATGHMRLAPSTNGAIRQFGAENYGMIAPNDYLMIHKDDFDKRFYRRPTAEEKPAKSDVKLSVSGNKGQVIRVTW